MLMRMLFGDVVREDLKPARSDQAQTDRSDMADIVRMLGVEDYRETHEVVKYTTSPARL